MSNTVINILKPALDKDFNESYTRHRFIKMVYLAVEYLFGFRCVRLWQNIIQDEIEQEIVLV